MKGEESETKFFSNDQLRCKPVTINLSENDSAVPEIIRTD